jgi:myosin heavy subunit
MRRFKDELIRQDQARHKRVAQIQERQDELSGSRDKVSEAIANLFARMAKLRAYKAQTHGKMDTVVNNLYGELEAEKERSMALLEEIEALKKQQAALQTDQKDEALAEKEAALSKLQGQMAAFKQNINEKQRKQLELISELDGRKIYLTDMIRTLEANRAAKQAQDSQLGAKIKELEAALQRSLRQSQRLEELNSAAKAAHQQHLAAQSAGLKRAREAQLEAQSAQMKQLEAQSAELQKGHQKEMEAQAEEMKKLEAQAVELRKAHLAELEAIKAQAATAPPAPPKTPVIQVVTESKLYEEVVADLIDELAGCKAELISALGLVKGLLGSEYGLLSFEANESVAIEAAKYMHEYQAAAVITEKAPAQPVVPQIQADEPNGDATEEGEPTSQLNLSIPVRRQGQRKVRATQK